MIGTIKINCSSKNSIKMEDDFALEEQSVSLSGTGSDMPEYAKDSGVYYFVLPSVTEIDGVLYTTYGIGAAENNQVVDSILDLSTNLSAVKSFVNLCNTEELSLIHFRDAVEDFMVLFYAA